GSTSRPGHQANLWSHPEPYPSGQQPSLLARLAPRPSWRQVGDMVANTAIPPPQVMLVLRSCWAMMIGPPYRPVSWSAEAGDDWAARSLDQVDHRRVHSAASGLIAGASPTSTCTRWWRFMASLAGPR